MGVDGGPDASSDTGGEGDPKIQSVAMWRGTPVYTVYNTNSKLVAPRGLRRRWPACAGYRSAGTVNWDHRRAVSVRASVSVVGAVVFAVCGSVKVQAGHRPVPRLPTLRQAREHKVLR